MAQVSRLLEGSRDTRVRLRLRRGGKRIDVELTRRPLPRSSVVGYLAGDDKRAVGVIRLPQFAEGAGAEVRRELDLLGTEAGVPLAAVVLDMRGNTGGWVEEAVATADIFLGDALVASIESRRDPIKRWRTTVDATDLQMPVVVLVDGGCRSSCELLAAGLRDNDRALVVGAATYGKGTVQGVFPADAGPWSIFLTIARYLGPRGGAIQALGIEPDVLIPVLVTAADRQRREADHDNALAPTSGTAAAIARPAASPLATAAVLRCAATQSATTGWRARLHKRDAPLLIAVEHGLCLATR